MHEMAAPIAAWESFYVIVGSSAAALTGLQFVVMALVADSGRQSSGGEIDAFGTPTVVHFSLALLVAAILSAPWSTLTNPGLALGATGLGGLIYGAIVIRRARKQKGYKPVFEDWLWHGILPFLSYLGLGAAGVFLPSYTVPALYGIGAATLLLVFIGIHNSWDTVTFITITQVLPAKEREQEGKESPPRKSR